MELGVITVGNYVTEKASVYDSVIKDCLFILEQKTDKGSWNRGEATFRVNLQLINNL